MAHLHGQDAKLPKSKTSTPTLMDSLRNLKGGRTAGLRQAPPATPLGNNKATAEATEEPDLSSSSPETSRRTSMQDFDVDFHGFAAARGGFVGAPDGFMDLIDELGSGWPADMRARAARRITKVLEQHPLDNVISIWYRARDIVDFITTPEACHAGYALLVACSKCKTLGPSDRNVLLACVEKFLTVNGERTRTIPQEYLIYQVHALSELTEQGRNTHSLEDRIVPVVELLFDACYNYARDARRKVKGTRSLVDPSHHEPLDQTFDYASDLIKYKSQAIGDDGVKQIVDKVFSICKQTSSENDILLALKLLDTVFAYAFPIDTVLRASLEVLCSVHTLTGVLQEKSWEIVLNLLNSHRGRMITDALLKIMSNAPKYSAKEFNIVRGAVQLMENWIESHEQSQLPHPTVPSLLAALKIAITLRSRSREMHVLRTMKKLVNRRDQVKDLLEGTGWEDFKDILLQCVQMQINWSGPNQPISPTLHKTEPALSAEPFVNSEASKVSEPLEFSRVELEGIVRNLLEVTLDMGHEVTLIVNKLALESSQPLSDEIVDGVLSFYVDRGLLGPSNPAWIQSCRLILEKVFFDHGRSVERRKSALRIVADAYQIGDACGNSDVRTEMISLVEHISFETQPELLSELLAVALDSGLQTLSRDLFHRLISILQSSILAPKAQLDDEEDLGHHTWSSESQFHTAKEIIGSAAADCLVRLFLRTVNESVWKCQRVFLALLETASSTEPHPKARITVLKVLFRIRSDVNYRIYVTPDTHCQTVAASLCRTVDTSRGNNETAPGRASYQEEPTTRRRGITVSTSTETVRHSSSRPRVAFDVKRRTPPLWMYPGPGGLPEEPPSSASEILSSRLVKSEEEADAQEGVAGVLPMGEWLERVLQMLTSDDFEWETYSYILVHMGVQLSNHSLFVDAVPGISQLRVVVCRQLVASNFHDAPSFTNLKKSDVASCFYHMLTMLVSYHKEFTKPEEDEIVRAFLLGIGTREGNAERCIHGLSVCCHELPASIVKSLDGILDGMSRIVTQAHAAVHILEFLTGLARSPELFKNLTQGQYKDVFGICCQYLHYAREQKETAGPRAARQSSARHSSSSSSRDNVYGESKPKALADELPQYVYAMAYHAVAFWFMSLRMEDRPARMAELKKQLHYFDSAGVLQLEEQSETTIDMMERVCDSDRDETRYIANFAKLAEDGKVAKKNWLVGYCIVTVETAGRSGKSQLIYRRASGTRYSSFQPQLVLPPPHQTPITRGSAADAYYTDDWVGIKPENIFQEFYGPLKYAPILLPDDDMTRRAIDSFDRISPLDGHKIGIVYIGEAQTEEAVILANQMGSADYTAFLGHMGTLMKLRGATFNTQGLDREYNTDGDFTYCWRDRVTEIVFHVTTMMPSNSEADPLGTQKKKHIGNDFVNIIFNNSGLPFDTNTFRSDFNYVNIVITPEARATFLDTRLAQEASLTRPSGTTPFDDMFYRVTVMSKEGIPNISPASETKILSFPSLANFIRPIAINASVFSSVWAAGSNSEHISSWRARLRAIKTLHERHQPAAAPRDPYDHTSPPGTAWGGPMSPASATPSGGTFSLPMSQTASQLPRSRSGMFTGGGGGGGGGAAYPVERESAFYSGPRPTAVETAAAAAAAAARGSLGSAGTSRADDATVGSRRGSASSDEVMLAGSRSRIR